MNLLYTKGLDAVLWAEMQLIFLKLLSCDLGAPVAAGMNDASKEKAEWDPDWGHKSVITWLLVSLYLKEGTKLIDAKLPFPW